MKQRVFKALFLTWNTTPEHRLYNCFVPDWPEDDACHLHMLVPGKKKVVQWHTHIPTCIEEQLYLVHATRVAMIWPVSVLNNRFGSLSSSCIGLKDAVAVAIHYPLVTPTHLTYPTSNLPPLP